MSEAKAQAKAIRDQLLADLGAEYNKIDPTEFPVGEQMLIYYGKAFNDAVQKYLSKSGSIATGKIGDLVVPKVNKFGNNYEMILGYDKENPAADYYDFVNKGVKGVGGDNARPKKIGNTPYKFKSIHPGTNMINSLEAWYKLGKAKIANETQKKKLSKTQRKNKKLAKVKPATLRDVAIATGYAIKRDGLKSTYFFDNAVKEIFDEDFFDTMAVTFGGDIQLKLKQVGNKIEKNGNNSK